ncbi:MAG: PorT family protein [Muribaculaceae bacterium]|nr:PorT family protein [Muribaculaceae bacterium]
MKKIATALLLAVVALTTSFQARAEFNYGIKAGVNIEHMKISKDLLDANNRAGYTVGVTGEYIAPVIGLGVDLSVMFSRMYATMYTEDAKMRTGGSFIEIPVHLKYRISIPAISSVLRPYIFTGPNAAIKVSGSESFFYTKRAQWGWDLGLGLEFFKHLQIGAGYTFGMNNIAKIIYTETGNSNYGEVSNTIKLRNNYWTITAAYMF